MLLRRLLPALCLLLLPLTATAQTAEEVLRRVHDRTVDQLEDVDTYMTTVTMQGAMDLFDSLHVYVRRTDAGTFETRTKAFGGMADMANQMGASTAPTGDLLATNRQLYTLFKDVATYAEKTLLDGYEVHVLAVEDATPLYRSMAGDEGMPDAMEARNARLYIDAETWDPRKMEMDVTTRSGGEVRTMHTVTEMRDYRQVGPMRYPFRVINRMSSPLSEAERAEMAARHEEMKKQLEKLPEAQRKQIEGMLEMSDAITGEEMEMVIVTERLRVNEPLPDGVFE